MSLPFYEKDRGFKIGTDGNPYVVIDHLKVGINPEDDRQLEILME